MKKIKPIPIQYSNSIQFDFTIFSTKIFTKILIGSEGNYAFPMIGVSVLMRAHNAYRFSPVDVSDSLAFPDYLVGSNWSPTLQISDG